MSNGPPNAANPRPRRQRLIGRFLACVVLMLVAWHTLPIGWLAPLVVQDVSMAPTLLGQHLEALCPGCGIRYPIEWLPVVDPDSQSTCAGCGRLHALGSDLAPRGGDRVWIDRLARWSGPGRDQWWAFRDRENPGRWLVKRVVGLPGERIDLIHGDLWVNGRVLPKSLDALRDASVPVMSFRADGHPTPSSVASLCWNAAAGSAWIAGDRIWSLPAMPGDSASREQASGDSGDSGDGWHWLEFTGTEVAGRRGTAGLLLDDYSFHQSVSRALHPMSDLWLSLELEWPELDEPRGAAVVAVEWRDAWQSCRAEWDWGADEVRLMEGVVHDASMGTSARLVFAAWDGQAVAAWREQGRWKVLQRSLPGERGGVPQLRELRLGVRGAGCRVRAIELRRDLYLYDARRDAGAAGEHAGVPVQLEDDQFFMLGDNGPQSIDSRDQGPVDREQLVGRVRKSR